MKFDFYLPVNLVFGRGRTASVGELAASYGRKALVVTGGNSTKRSGLLERVTDYLEKAGLSVEIFDKVTPNPLTTTAIEGARIFQEIGCEVVVGVGGGSVMDCAKAISFLAVNEGDINDYIFNRISADAAAPCILIPTTCGTGSEGNGFAVLTNPENGDKKSLRTSAIIAKASIIDSELMETMPQKVLASVGFDALCHCMEAYLAPSGQPIMQQLALSGIETVGKCLLPLFEGSRCDDTWDGLAWASTIGGMVINMAGVVLPHGMEHPASGLKNIVHGEGLAALTPVITEHSVCGAPEKYGEISRRLGGNSAKDCAGVLRTLIKSLEMPTALGAQGIEEADIPWMTENCFKVSAVSIENHPVRFSREEISGIYQEAL